MKNNLQLAKNAKIEWNPDFRSTIKQTDIKLVLRELKEIEDHYGEITPHLLVESSKRKKSVFHDYFEWDDEKAGHAWRIAQARYFIGGIRVRTIKEGKPIQMQAYQIVSAVNPAKKGQAPYTKFDSLSEDNLQYIQRKAIKDLVGVKNKLQSYDFDAALPLIDKAIDILKKGLVQISESE